MKAKVIRSFIDKYTMQDIDKGAEIEVTEERFSELTTGPQGVFVEEIREKATEVPPTEQEGENATDEEPPKEEVKEDKKKSTKK